jgi:predicted Zn-ribbon and HTH transcriptional regulator
MPNGRILFAPSGSGKSTFAKERGGYVDGDDIIEAQIGWPPGTWWTLPNAEEETNKRIDVLFEYAAKHPDKVVLTGLRSDSFAPKRAGVDTRVFIPSEARVAGYNFKNRHINQPNQAQSIAALPEWRQWAKSHDLVSQRDFVWE